MAVVAVVAVAVVLVLVGVGCGAACGASALEIVLAVERVRYSCSATDGLLRCHGSDWRNDTAPALAPAPAPAALEADELGSGLMRSRRPTLLASSLKSCMCVAICASSCPISVS